MTSSSTVETVIFIVHSFDYFKFLAKCSRFVDQDAFREIETPLPRHLLCLDNHVFSKIELLQVGVTESVVVEHGNGLFFYSLVNS